MKKLLSLALILMLCLAFAANAEEANEQASPRFSQIVRSTEIEGVQNSSLILEGDKTDAGLNNAMAHVEELQKQGTAVYGKEIAKKLEDYKHVCTAPITVEKKNIESASVKVTVKSELTQNVKKDSAVTLVICVPNDKGAYDFYSVDGIVNEDGELEFELTEEIIALLPEFGAIFDVYAVM